MPLSIYKNSSFTLTTNSSNEAPANQQSEFFLTNYTRSITLLDACLFDYDHLQFAYSELAAAALYHTLCQTTRERRGCKGNRASSRFAAHLVHKSTGCSVDEIDRCVKWMRPFADVCADMMDLKSVQFVDEDPDNAHNIQINQNYRLWLVSILFKSPI